MEKLPKLLLAITYGKPETKAVSEHKPCCLSTMPPLEVTAAQQLLQLSAAKDNRSALAYHPGLLPAVCAMMANSGDAPLVRSDPLFMTHHRLCRSRLIHIAIERKSQ